MRGPLHAPDIWICSHSFYRIGTKSDAVILMHPSHYRNVPDQFIKQMISRKAMITICLSFTVLYYNSLWLIKELLWQKPQLIDKFSAWCRALAKNRQDILFILIDVYHYVGMSYRSVPVLSARASSCYKYVCLGLFRKKNSRNQYYIYFGSNIQKQYWSPPVLALITLH